MAGATRKDIEEVIEAVSTLATQVDKRFEKIDTQLSKIKGEVGELKERFDVLQTSVDSVATDNKDARDERISTKSRLDRHERWIEKVAEVSGVKLN